MSSEHPPGAGAPPGPGTPRPGAESPHPEAPPAEAPTPPQGDPPRSSDLRLHPAAIAVGAVEAIGGFVLPLAVLGGATLLGGGVDVAALIRVAVYGVIATAVALGLGYVRWATTVYRLDDDAMYLRRGVLNRQQASVPVERISSIDTVQGPIHRLMGVTELRIQAAGGGQEPEIRLLALSREAVADLREHAARAGGGPPADTTTEAPPIARLSRGSLFVAALTSGQITVVLPVLAALSQSLDDLAGRGGEAQALERYLVPETLGDALLLLVVLVLAAWVLAITGTIVAFSGFTVVRDDDRLRIRRGLLQRRVSSIPVGRIQAIRVVDGLLRQPLGLVSLRVESAGYAKERSVNTTLFPLLRRDEAEEFLRRAVPGLAAPLGPLERPPRRAAWIYVGAPALAATAIAVPAAAIVSPFALLLVPAAFGLGLLRLRAAGSRLDHGLLVVRSRRLARTTILAAGSKLPERAFAQGPLARRLRLATLAFALASRSRWTLAHTAESRVRSLIEELRPST